MGPCEPNEVHKTKCKVVHWCWVRPRHEYRLGDEWTLCPAENDLGVPVLEKINMSWQCALAAQVANCILDCINREVARRTKEVIVALCSALVWSYLQSCFKIWAPQLNKNMELLEWVYKRAMKMTRGLKHPSYKERL